MATRLSRAYLSVNGVVLPVKRDDYTVSYTDVVSDDGGTTEAGTTIRSVIREGAPSISASFTVSESMLVTLRNLKRQSSVSVIFYDAGVLSDAWDMYIDNFQFNLLADDGYNAVYSVSMTLEDLASV